MSSFPVFSGFVRPLRRALWWGLCAACWGGAGLAAAQAPLPPEIEAALTRSRLPRESVSLLVTELGNKRAPRLALRPNAPMNPASVMKLLTTQAALDLLGPAYSWNTPVYLDGPVRDGTLQGNLVIKGQGDPKLVLERLWLLLRRVQGLGIRQISGDIVLDRSAFDLPASNPADFDGEPLKPYNAASDALLINYRSLVLTFVPDPAAGVAHVQLDPPLAGVQWTASVPLLAGDCGDWRTGLKAQLSDPARINLAGGYPANCGEKLWPQAYADPASYNARAIAALWQDLGGRLGGQVRDGRVPAGLKPVFSLASPPLAEVIRDINKFSNNVMAQQLFLTLSLAQKGVGTPEGSRELLGQWWRSRFGEADAPVIDNGSGLSRETRVSAQALARVLQAAWAGGTMPELLASLPLSGVDGTMRRWGQGQNGVVGAAHLKTGSLRDVTAVAGVVHGASGRRYALVALANHPQAGALRPVIEALIDWTARDQNLSASP
ncbi:D-alanyl-D-alanine carboxypeptidase/D-alanyl-D-alanine-endopeptidase [Curvibacter sp. RS43]|uniref:D-alanyl-D-alanine carboxypeptidase/D-alanyl-D-alanine endopeptidase n=1 Tax=Curvibacter microcysteis TaxID=3026419 RepID=UPI00235E8F6A|nr:D-alanyl-D-alanine carboxypeptidase/D-alanyl-D-alanine-endopeptidase [Curvibacter sp. RS43]MDD0810869.1 D-alanyl-D-alanine carboxypeptidase/D-alanyl-D-alanine-endopeptidase [Curvibacter sp. RS43]